MKLAAVLFLATILAGCAATPSAVGPLADEAPAAIAADAAPKLLYLNRTVIGAPGNAAVCFGECMVNKILHVPPPEGAVAMIAELRWSGPPDLDLRLNAETYKIPGDLVDRPPSATDDDGLPGAPDSPARVEVTDATDLSEGRKWSAIVSGKGAANVDFELVVSIFTTPPPADYTAFGDGA